MTYFKNFTNEQLKKEIPEIEKIIKQLKGELKFCYTENDKKIQKCTIKNYEELLENIKNELNERMKKLC